jgi:nicotinate-nucleotide adenylyltransferase
MKHIAILGGTFNPIHIAHLKMAEFVYSTGKYDEILFIPTGKPPHKADGTHIVSKKHRFNMCILATKETPYFDVSDIELKRKGTSYTVDTLQQLKEENPDNEYSLIIGADSLLNLTKWHNPKQLLKIGKFIVINRPGYENLVSGHINYLVNEYQTSIELLNMPVMPISSSKIRLAILENQSIEGFVPEAVENYINEHHLYAINEDDDINMEKLQKRLKKNLSDKRFIHSVSVMETAINLAMHYGIDIEKAAIAGLLHDCAKSLSNKRKLELAVQYSFKLSDAEFENPDLLHAKLGAIVAKEEYGINDSEILNAIDCHTTGKPNMTTLDKIIYIADYIEPKRKPLPRIDYLRELAMKSLDQALVEIIYDTIEHLKQQKRIIDLRSLETYSFYKNINSLEESEEKEWQKMH